MMDLLKKRPGASLLGLAFDGSGLAGAVVRRTNGSLEIKRTFTAALSLDLQTNAPDLVGREIRKLLDEAGVRERQCVVGLPLKWAITLQVKLPDLPEADLESFLQIEAERGLPYGMETLIVAQSRFRSPGGEQFATLVAVSRDQVSRLEIVLKAAQLKPVSFSLGLAALQDARQTSSEAVLALMAGESSVGVQILCGGGLAALRMVDGAFELVGSERELQPEAILRELRITLGQLPPDVQEAVQRVQVFGCNELADELAEIIHARFQSLGIGVEQVKHYPPEEFGPKLPANTPVSPALSLAARHLTGQGTGLEFLPPKVSQWKQLTTRYSSGKLVWTGTAVGAVAAVIALAFLGQQLFLWHWQSKWGSIAVRAKALESTERQIVKYRPWFDESFQSLTVLQRLTEAFPEEGTVSAKTVEIREPAAARELPKVTCTGTARDRQVLLQVSERLSAAPGVKDLNFDQQRGASPVEFALNFKFAETRGKR